MGLTQVHTRFLAALQRDVDVREIEERCLEDLLADADATRGLVYCNM